MAHKPKSDTSPESWLERGVALQREGKADAALACYARIPARHPAHADALHLSGIIHSQKGDPARGAELIGKAISIAPAAALYHVNLANAREALGDAAGAENALRHAIAVDPKFAPALFNLGNLLNRTKRYDEAIGCFDRTIVADPSHVNACLALAELLQKQKNLPAVALQVAAKAKKIAPNDPRVSDLLITCLLANKRFFDVLQELPGRLAADPDNFELKRLEAFCLGKVARYSDAAAVYRHCIGLNPAHRNVGIELGQNYTVMGRVDAALKLFADMLETHPGDPIVISNRLFVLHYRDEYSPLEIADQHRDWEKRVSLDRPPYVHASAPTPSRRLRIGYASEDFRQHSVASFIDTVLAKHDRERFEVFAYFVNADPDDVTRRIRGHVDHFREFPRDRAPSEIAETMRADQLDIAVELSGHTSFRVLEAMLYRPAPVQITWLGYPSTSGVSTIDYRISDAIADPPGEGDEWNSEQVLRLPDCFHCFSPERPLPFDPVPPHARNGFVTFGSFNLLSKLSPKCCAAWARIVGAVPGARLLLKNRALHDPGVRAWFADQFVAAGLAEDRLIFIGDQAGWTEHMENYRKVDVSLDPFPYNGTTTTCEALWMGVPVLTLLGDRHAGRVGASLLTAIGHPELIAADLAEYERKAVELACDPARLTALHGALHGDLVRSPLCDAPRFVSNLEAAYLTALERSGESHH